MIIVFDPDSRFRAAVADILGDRTAGVATNAELDRAIAEERTSLDAVVIGPGTGTSKALESAERIQRKAPEVGIILVEQSLSSDVLQAALRAGVRDVLPAQLDSGALQQAVSRAEAMAQALRGRGGHGAEDGSPGRIITVFSPKGGVGKSTVATNLSVALAQKGESVVAVDLDLQFGDLAIMLQLFPARTIYDAANHAGELDADTILDYCANHRSGVALLPAPLEPGLAENVPAERAQTILRTLREAGRTVVVDTPPWFTDHVLSALDISDDMVLVATMDVPSIKNLKVALQTLEMLGYPRERLRIVLNRADSKVGLSSADVERALGTTVDVALPSSRDVPLSVNRGQPLAMSDPKASVSVALGDLVALVGARETAMAAASTERKPKAGRRGR